MDFDDGYRIKVSIAIAPDKHWVPQDVPKTGGLPRIAASRYDSPISLSGTGDAFQNLL
jgi:hypothetical protein